MCVVYQESKQIEYNLTIHIKYAETKFHDFEFFMDCLFCLYDYKVNKNILKSKIIVQTCSQWLYT